MAGPIDRVMKVLEQDVGNKRTAIRLAHEAAIVAAQKAVERAETALKDGIRAAVTKALSKFPAKMGRVDLDETYDRGGIVVKGQKWPALAKARTAHSAAVQKLEDELARLTTKALAIRRHIALYGVDDALRQMLAEL